METGQDLGKKTKPNDRHSNTGYLTLSCFNDWLRLAKLTHQRVCSTGPSGAHPVELIDGGRHFKKVIG